MKKSVRVVHNASSGRIVEIDIEGKKVVTPTRALHHREIQAMSEIIEYREKGKLAEIEPLPHEIQETVLDLRATDFQRLSTDNKYFAYQKRKIKSLSGNGERRLKLCNLRIVSQKEPVSNESIHMLTQVQLGSGSLDMITVPDPSYVESEGSRFKAVLSAARKSLDDQGLDRIRLLPLVDMKTKPLELRNRFTSLLDNGFDSIAIRFRPSHEPSARQVALSLSDKDVWIHLSGVPSKVSRQPIIPQIHLMPYFSFDSISSFKGFGSPPPRKVDNDTFRMPTVSERKDPDPHAQGIIPIRSGPTTKGPDPRFDPLALGFLTREKHFELHGSNLNCNCFLCREHDLDSFYNDYGYSSDKTSRKKLRKHLLIHELFSSYHELQNSHQSIKEESYKRYLKNKPIINEYGSSIDDVDMTTLDDFF